MYTVQYGSSMESPKSIFLCITCQVCQVFLQSVLPLSFGDLETLTKRGSPRSFFSSLLVCPAVTLFLHCLHLCRVHSFTLCAWFTSIFCYHQQHKILLDGGGAECNVYIERGRYVFCLTSCARYDMKYCYYIYYIHLPLLRPLDVKK